MKIVWRNPNGIAPIKMSIAKIGRVEAADIVQLLYRSSSCMGLLGTDFELLVNRSNRHAA